MREELEQLQPINPVSRSWAQGRSVDELWLTRKRPLTNIQRFALLLLSAFIGAVSCDLLGWGIAGVRDGDIALGSIMALIGIAGVCLAIRGIWRVAWDVFKGPVAEPVQRETHNRSPSQPSS